MLEQATEIWEDDHSDMKKYIGIGKKNDAEGIGLFKGGGGYTYYK